MGIFVRNFIKNHASKVASSAKGYITNQFQKINEALSRYKQALLENTPRYDSLICALTQDPTFISDDMIADGTHSITDCLSVAPIRADDAQNLYQGVVDAITNDGYDNQRGLTLTDAKGHFYTIIDQKDINGQFPVVDGCEILLSSSIIPSSLSESVLYRDGNGNYFLNNVIRSGDFVKRNAAIVPQSTLLGMLQTCCFCAGKVIPNTLISGLSNLVDNSIASANYIDYIIAWANQKSVVIDYSSVESGLSDMQDYYIARWSAVGKGVFTSIWSLFSDLIESSTLNTAILSTIQAVQSFHSFSIDFFSNLEDKVGTKYNSVRTFMHGARDAFLKGGFTGLGTYILSYVKAISSLVDEDGLMSFSDNKNLVPQQYIAGLVWNIISAVVSVIGVIVTFFSKILGVVITVLGGIIGMIGQSFTADHNDTYAALQLSDDVILPIAPYALYQMKVNTSSLDSSILTQLKNGAELLAQEVPGGYIIIGPCSVNKDKLNDEYAEYYEQYPECMFKFYPSIIPHTANNALQHLLQDINSHQPIFSIPTWHSDTDMTVKFNKDCVFRYLLDNNKGWDYISQLYVDSAQDVEYRNDETSGMLKDEDQINQLSDAVISNMCWFILWAISTRGIMSDWVSQDIATPYNNATAYFYADNDGAAYSWPIPYCFNDEHMISLAGGKYLGTFISGSTMWAEFGYYAKHCNKYPIVKLNPDAKPIEVRSLINNGHAIDEVLDTPSRMSFAIKTPKYDPDTFWFWVVFSAVVIMAVTAIAVVLTLKAKRAINRKRAQNQASVEAAWDRMKQNPTAENYSNYRSVVKRNNRWATFIGGTKYDYVNYWNGDISATNDGSASGSILSGLDLGSNSLNPVADSNDTLTTVDIKSIRKLIAGEV